jgi:uncharacterized protein (TIGR00297 family)
MSYLASFLAEQGTRAGHQIAEWVAISVLFAALGRLVRGVTTGGAIAGAVVCFLVLLAGGVPAFAALFSVFVLTWLSTRIGYSRKQGIGTAEDRAGRNALQVLANLGAAAGCAILLLLFGYKASLLVAMIAALAEPAADTVSSEIGQTSTGTARLITTWQAVPHGTNGAITFVGTIAGAIAAGVVALLFTIWKGLGPRFAVVCSAAGILGMLADSLLGATIENRGWLGNNAVNFISTLIAAAIAFLIAY